MPRSPGVRYVAGGEKTPGDLRLIRILLVTAAPPRWRNGVGPKNECGGQALKRKRKESPSLGDPRPLGKGRGRRRPANCPTDTDEAGSSLRDIVICRAFHGCRAGRSHTSAKPERRSTQPDRAFWGGWRSPGGGQRMSANAPKRLELLRVSRGLPADGRSTVRGPTCGWPAHPPVGLPARRRGESSVASRRAPGRSPRVDHGATPAARACASDRSPAARAGACATGRRRPSWPRVDPASSTEMSAPEGRRDETRIRVCGRSRASASSDVRSGACRSPARRRWSRVVRRVRSGHPRAVASRCRSRASGERAGEVDKGETRIETGCAESRSRSRSRSDAGAGQPHARDVGRRRRGWWRVGSAPSADAGRPTADPGVRAVRAAGSTGGAAPLASTRSARGRRTARIIGMHVRARLRSRVSVRDSRTGAGASRAQRGAPRHLRRL